MAAIQLWQLTLFRSSCRAKAGDMRNRFHLPLFAGLLLWASAAAAVPKPHVITFGKWTPVKWLVGPAESKPLDLKIRGLYVDTRLKEYTMGATRCPTRTVRLPDGGGSEVDGCWWIA
jgi:hypothetical protein